MSALEQLALIWGGIPEAGHLVKHNTLTPVRVLQVDVHRILAQRCRTLLHSVVEPVYERQSAL